MGVFAQLDLAGIGTGEELSAHDAAFSKTGGQSGDLREGSGRLVADASEVARYAHSGTPGAADYTVSATVFRPTGASVCDLRIFGRLDGAGTSCYWVRVLGGTVGLYKLVSGSSTQLGTNANHFISENSSKVVALVMSGSSISVTLDGSTVLGPTTDTSVTAAGRAGIGSGSNATQAFAITAWSADDGLGGDTTAPVLTGPTGTATGSTTATVGATTDEGNGTLYAFVSTSATPPAAATLKAGTGAAWSGSQAVSSTGAKTLNATGLTASTGYYAHLIHTDAAANDSNIVSSAQFTTSAPASPPTITDQPDSATVKRGQTATFTITASGATSYQWERDTGSGYADISGATSDNYTTPATTMADDGDLYRCKATNADGTTTSSAATLTVQQCVLELNAAGYEFGDGNSPATMAVLASTELQVAAYPLAEWPPASPVATATATTSAAGRLADMGDDDLIFGATYRVIARNAATGETWAWTMDAT